MHRPHGHVTPRAPRQQPAAQLLDTVETLTEVIPAARLAGTSVATVNALIAAGRIKITRYLGKQLVAVEAIEAELTKEGR